MTLLLPGGCPEALFALDGDASEIEVRHGTPRLFVPVCRVGTGDTLREAGSRLEARDRISE